MELFKKKVLDWEEKEKKLAEKVGIHVQIDWFELDHRLGTSVKRIYWYKGRRLIDIEPYNEDRISVLKEHIPVVDLTEGKPYPEQFKKIPRKYAIIGRLNLIDLEL